MTEEDLIFLGAAILLGQMTTGQKPDASLNRELQTAAITAAQSLREEVKKRVELKRATDSASPGQYGLLDHDPKVTGFTGRGLALARILPNKISSYVCFESSGKSAARRRSYLR